MKEFLITVIIVVFVYLCIKDYNQQTDDFYLTTSVEDNMEYLDSKIFISNGVPESSLQVLHEEIQNLPTKLWKKFLYDGGVLTITDEVDKENDLVIGSFDVTNNFDAAITVNSDYIPYSLCHEFSHYLYWVDDIGKQEGYKEMFEEKETVWRDLLQSNSYFYSDNEYFAEVGKLYFKGSLDRNVYPKTVEFWDSITEKYR